MTRPSAEAYYEIQGRYLSPPSEWFQVKRLADARNEEQALGILATERRDPSLSGVEHRLVRVETLVVIYPIEET